MIDKEKIIKQLKPLLLKTWRFAVSFPMVLVWLFLFAAAIGVATFIENDFSTQTAQAVIYHSAWFESIMVILALALMANIIKFKMYRQEKWIIFIFHLSFIFILIGAAVTRYIGYEGIMPIREGKASNWILSEKAYLMGRVEDRKKWRCI